MNWNRLSFAFIPFLLAYIPGAYAQNDKPSNAATAPPKLLMVVHQQFKFGSEGARQKLEVSIARASNHLEVPNFWISLQSLTGPPESLSFDPFDSFDQIENAYVTWGQLFAAHPELGQQQQQVRALQTSESTLVAVRRDDLGYRVNRIDLSKARYMRVLEIRLLPGHESEFVESFKLLSASYEKINADMPWVVYQVNVGMPSPAFLVFVPMRALKENDNYLSRAPKLREAEGDEGFGRMQQIARDAYASTESNLYAIRPEMSHVSKEIIDGDSEFWLSKPVAELRHFSNFETAEDRTQEVSQTKQRH